jgi:hypothetical protein
MRTDMGSFAARTPVIRRAELLPPVYVNFTMGGWLALGGLLLAGVAFLGIVFTFFVLMLKAALWLVLLPFRLIGWAVGAVFMLIGTAFAIIVGLAVILAPLLPLAIVAGIGYGIYRMMRRPAVA